LAVSRGFSSGEGSGVAAALARRPDCAKIDAVRTSVEIIAAKDFMTFG
jgi:hypothetical protein